MKYDRENEFLGEASTRINSCILNKCTTLDLSHLSIKSINDIPKLSDCKELKKLNLQNNIIRDISFLSELKNLQSLNLSWNSIENYKPLSELKNLRDLNLGWNRIFDIQFIGRLKDLEVLDLRNNYIDDMSVLSELVKLRILNISRNNIHNIDFIAKLINLEFLYIHNNNIKNISFLTQLRNLKNFNGQNNIIWDASPLKSLIKIENLNVSHNKLKDFGFLSKLKNLKNLDIRNTGIKEGHFLKKLINLKKLDIRWNLISDFGFLNNFKKIEEVEYKGNLIEDPPYEIVEQGKASVIDWLKAKRKYLNEIKIILVGDPKAGKTSLLKRLKDGTFNEKEVQTDGVNIEDIDFSKVETFKNQKKTHHLTGHFWDFGGQEIMSATHSFFLTNRSVYVLVLDARKDKQVSATIRKEVKRIKATGGDSPIIVVANQIDVNPGFGFENEYELQQEFPQIKHFVKASCKEKTNMELLKDRLEEQILEAELLNTKIDERWIAIKEQFQKELPKEHYLDEDRFIEICNNHKLSEEFKQQNALRFLHDLGLVLNFKKIKGYDYYVLDPYWITYGVYQILTSKKAGDLEGIIPFKDLEYIINEEEDKKKIYQPKDFKRIQYSKNQREFLVQILHEFKLCFIVKEEDKFIIPNLLSTEEPTLLTEPMRKTKDSIRFVYSYEYLPHTLMPNILVEMHQYREKIWRTGCVLNYNESKGFISHYDNKLSIVVTGEYRKKGEFLALIRSCINKINRRTLSDPPKMLIPLPRINDYAPYKRLLNLEKRGERTYYHYDNSREEEVPFNIKELLDGIHNEDKLWIIIDEIKTLQKKTDRNYKRIEKIPIKEELENILDKTIGDLNTIQTTGIANEVTKVVGKLFKLHQGHLDESLKDLHNELQKTDDFQSKIKMGIPLIGEIVKVITGVQLEMEFDVKSWGKKMFKKYEWQMFKWFYEPRE